MGPQESGGSLHLDDLGIGRRSCGRQHPSHWGSSGEAGAPQPSLIEPDCVQRFARQMTLFQGTDKNGTLGMDHLKSKSPAMVDRALAVYH
jgi:hypothetical protein